MSKRPPKPPRAKRGQLPPKRIDTTTRELLADNPPAWTTYFGLRVRGLMKVMDSNVATTAAETDQVYETPR